MPSRRKLPDWYRDLAALIPGYDPEATAADGEYFAEGPARLSIDFFPQHLVFIEGERAGQPFHLELWQQAVNATLFGWRRADHTRRYRETLIYVPRKNGKTPWMAGIADLVMFEDGEPGAQLYSAAADREQAALIYRHASGMIARNPEMAELVRTYRSFKSIEYPAQGTVFKALSSDAETKHGLGAHLVIVDELHAHPNSDLVDVLKTSTAARRQPLVIYITTADYARESVCNRIHDYASKVRDGDVADSSFLPVIYEATADDDWTDPATWAKANPNLNVSVKLPYLKRECARAQNEPSYENVFKRLHCNIKTQQDVRWIPREKWDLGHDGSDPLAWRDRMLAELAGQQCVGALDLGATQDLTALALLFGNEADGFDWLPFFWIARDCARQRAHRDRVPYEEWIDQGYMIATDGDTTDFGQVERDIDDLANTYGLHELAVDRLFQGDQLIQNLMARGLNAFAFGQGFMSMAGPAKRFYELILAKKLRHGGNPVLRWMAANAAVEMDAAGNIKPSKKKSTERIDGIVTGVMAVGRAMVVEPVSDPYMLMIG